MNTPNKLTILRIILTPIFMVTLLVNFKFHYIVALLIFIVASLTDLIDGKMARKYNLVTDFGKFLDPLADKMLTTAAFLGFIALDIGIGSVWIAFIVLFREFMISSMRLVAVSSGGKVIAANIFGKLKTVSQMTAIIYAITVEAFADLFPKLQTVTNIFRIGTSVLLWVSAILCIISGVIYMLDNKEFVDPSK